VIIWRALNDFSLSEQAPPWFDDPRRGGKMRRAGIEMACHREKRRPSTTSRDWLVCEIKWPTPWEVGKVLESDRSELGISFPRESGKSLDSSVALAPKQYRGNVNHDRKHAIKGQYVVRKQRGSKQVAGE
jgi:hypothetical protein